ncbi:hypothetical protein CB1_000311002 [Camelus ferus]|nr:hypothetical protein CB1_000311002 [Camelus ferus]
MWGRPSCTWEWGCGVFAACPPAPLPIGHPQAAVFQRRSNGSVGSSQDWAACKWGFGSQLGELWLRNGHLQALAAPGGALARLCGPGGPEPTCPALRLGPLGTEEPAPQCPPGLRLTVGSVTAAPTIVPQNTRWPPSEWKGALSRQRQTDEGVPGPLCQQRVFTGVMGVAALDMTALSWTQDFPALSACGASEPLTAHNDHAFSTKEQDNTKVM